MKKALFLFLVAFSYLTAAQNRNFVTKRCNYYLSSEIVYPTYFFWNKTNLLNVGFAGKVYFNKDKITLVTGLSYITKNSGKVDPTKSILTLPIYYQRSIHVPFGALIKFIEKDKFATQFQVGYNLIFPQKLNVLDYRSKKKMPKDYLKQMGGGFQFGLGYYQHIASNRDFFVNFVSNWVHISENIDLPPNYNPKGLLIVPQEKVGLSIGLGLMFNIK